MARLNQTAMEAQSTQSYANMLTTAQPPADASSPKIGLNVALSVFLGLVLALGLVLLLEMTDRRVRATEDLVISLGLPVLGTMPKPSVKRFTGGHRPSLAQQRVIGLPAPGKNA
jgi:succinoglycan biosynthesis transport protein ExoP